MCSRVRLPRDSEIGLDSFKKLVPCVTVLWMEVSLFTVNQQGRSSDMRDTLTAASHLLISSLVQVSGSPFGSSDWGNMSPPQIDQTPTAVIKPVKAMQMALVSIFRLMYVQDAW